ncbi:MAG: hypothetical protein M1818_002282 [Claussenomyces sp. TS43310]|nr:MAG: hypothetical protein M1818_002282 [Claussenomyces sp. TS43310]
MTETMTETTTETRTETMLLSFEAYRTEDATELLSDSPLSTEVLLKISDDVRRALKGSRGMSQQRVRLLNELLQRLIEDETKRNSYAVRLSTIVDARLDRLLEGLVASKHNVKETAPQFNQCVVRSILLYKLWQTRFGSKLLTIDQRRRIDLCQVGSLAGVSLDTKWEIGRPLWTTESLVSRVDGIGSLGFQTGAWWLSTQCAYRDGIVNSMNGSLKTGAYGLTSLVLLHGEELEGSSSKEIVYIREGRMKDVGSRLLLHLGKIVRLLRNYTLRSRLAPSAGLRYDGLANLNDVYPRYKLERYGLKLNPGTNRYRMTVVLEKVDLKNDTAFLTSIPTASQLDDWEAYRKMEDDHVQAKLGLTEFEKWRTEQWEEEGKRRRWHDTSKMKIEDGFTMSASPTE